VVTVFLNPAAGGQQPDDITAQLAAHFDAAGLTVRIVTLDAAGGVDDAVRAALAGGADTVVAAGGDGTVSSIASALVGTGVLFGVLPLGTLNHFAKDLGIPIDLAAAVRTIAQRRGMAVDVGEVNGRPFLNNSSIGIYPDIVLERETLRERGYRKWPALAVATASVLSRYPGLLVRVTAGDATQVFRTPFLFVGNNEYELEGIRVGSRRTLSRGQLFACVAPRLRARDLPILAALALAGRAKENPALSSFCSLALQVDTPGRRRIRVALDGEVLQLTTPLRYRVRAAALRVIVP
jgi:diacylglycerol kinase family enzyme